MLSLPFGSAVGHTAVARGIPAYPRDTGQLLATPLSIGKHGLIILKWQEIKSGYLMDCYVSAVTNDCCFSPP